MALKTAGTGQPVPAVYVITKWRKIGKVRADDRFILLWYTDLNKKYENELKMKIPVKNDARAAAARRFSRTLPE